MRERIWKCWNCLNRRECVLSNRIRVSKTENTSHLVQCNAFLNFKNIWIQVLNVIAIAKNKGLCWIETKCNNILYVGYTHFPYFIQFKLLLIQELLVICNLNDKRNIKHPLKILCEDKWNGMTHMECFIWWTSTSVKIKWLKFLVSLQANIKISVTEKHASSNKPMGFFFSALFKLSNKFRSHFW